jgi:chromosome segregation ATPase
VGDHPLGLGLLQVIAECTAVETPTESPPPGPLSSLHPRLTVLQAAANERARLAEHLARLLVRADDDAPTQPSQAVGPDDLLTAAREAAARRVEEHARVRSELAAKLRRVRELQAVTANRRDEAAARTRRMTAHLDDCDSLLERAGELTNAAEEARRNLDDRRAEAEAARSKLSMVEEQRAAAAQMIEDASAQLADLEVSELDESTLRRELEKARKELHAVEQEQAAATDTLRAIEQAAAARAATRDHLLYERADLVARVEAPVVDDGPLRSALEAFDADTEVGEPDLAARELAREWLEVDGELARIEAALPPAPSADEMAAAEQRLAQAEQSIVELESAARQAEPVPDGRAEIEAAHEAVLDAEEQLGQADDDANEELRHAREAERAVLHRHGYETYLEMIMSAPRPEDEESLNIQADMLDALRARRVAEDNLASLRAAAEPPAIVTTLRGRRDRVYQEAAELLGCEPGLNVAELLYAHPAVPHHRTQALASVLASYGVDPVGVSVREAAVGWLVEQDRELAARDEWRREIERLDRDLAALDEEDVRATNEAERVVASADAIAGDLDVAMHRVRTLEDELSDRATQDERRLQRIAAAEQLRAQIAAVNEALERSEQEYDSTLAASEAAVTAAEASLERATAALSDAVRRLRRISEALPPALRPRAGDDPLGELPRLRETLAAEVERADVALAQATDDLDRARADIDETQAQLDDHLTVVPGDDVTDDDLRQAVHDLIGTGDVPVVIDDPFAEVDELREALLDEVAAAAERRPVVVLTDDPATLGWAISLPDDVGAVTRLPAPDAPTAPPPAAPPPSEPTPADAPLAAGPGPAG